MKIKCAVFDFDGTLFDSMFVWENAAEIYLRSIGKEPKPSTREDIRTLSLYQSACYFKQEYRLPFSAEEITRGINRTVEDFYTYEVMPKAGVVDFLEQMKKAEIPMCIATASEHCQIKAALCRCGLEHYFEAIFTCSKIGYGKDKPVIYQKAAEYFGADRSSAVIFEDAFHAIQTAKTDGFTVVAVFDDSEKRQAEIRDLSDCYITDFEHTEEFWKLVSIE